MVEYNEVVFLEKNFEIEFKNLLTKEEYIFLLAKYFPVSSDKKNELKISQSNYYFDTIEKELKKQHSALRIRVADSFSEMTLKVPHEDFLMETNLHLSDNTVSEIIQNKQLTLASVVPSDKNFPPLKNMTMHSLFYLFNSFQTIRFERKMAGHLIVLDQTTFQNGKKDYELEVESEDAAEGQNFFASFLAKNEIPLRKADPKIQRAEQNK